MQNVKFIKSLDSQKYPLVITLIFFLVISYVTFFHHHYWFENDGIFYLHVVGSEIIHGDGKNVKLFDSPAGGPAFYGILNSFTNDDFLTAKIVSLLSGTGIVFFAYYIIKNIFNVKIALIGQLFVACNPRLNLESIYAMNELLPIFLIFISLYFITKKHLRLYDIVITGSLLGISSMIRFQGMPVFIAIFVFLLIRNKQIRINLSYCLLLGIFFLLAFSPLILYNYYTHGTIIDTDSNFYMLTNWKYQTPEWRHKISENILDGKSSGLFLDFNLFLKNYFYNLFYHNPNRLFNFNTLNNISIIPPIPFLGIIPVIGGLIYSLKISPSRTSLIILLGISTITTFLVYLFGDFSAHFFAIIMIPLLSLGILNIRNVERNFLPLLILSVVYFLVISTVPVGKADHLFPMWIIIPTLSAIFFIETLPKIFLKIRSVKDSKLAVQSKNMSILFIILILTANLVFSYVLLYYALHDEASYSDIKNEFFKLFQRREPQRESGYEVKQIGDVLSKQPGIENSYVMSGSVNYAYYAHSKFVYTNLQEGVKNDSLNDFVTRENWTALDRYVSNISSNPTDRYDIYHPLPDYFIYNPLTPNAVNPWNVNNTQFEDLKVLANPDNPRIPPNFELLFKSNKTGTVVYKINHQIDK